MTKETMYLVTSINFDFDEEHICKRQREDLTQDTIGLWYARDLDHLIEKITDTMGWCVKDINATTNTLHPLTSYL
jgi:hypothetical protein